MTVLHIIADKKLKFVERPWNQHAADPSLVRPNDIPMEAIRSLMDIEHELDVAQAPQVRKQRDG